MVFFFVFSVIGVCLALSRGGAAPAFLPVASNDAAAGGVGWPCMPFPARAGWDFCISHCKNTHFVVNIGRKKDETI
jgi:hypothetical protein